jgi:aminomethyltransferase
MTDQSETKQETLGAELKRTPLFDLHVENGGRMVPFAGYEMPVQYKLGILKEHVHTRSHAGLFDVSHMGQAFLTGPDLGNGDDSHLKTARMLERLVPGAMTSLKRGAMRYSLLLNDRGCILDDLMVTRPGSDDNQGRLFLVVNADTKASDFAYITERLDNGFELEVAENRALIALQGPSAGVVLGRICPQADELTFMYADVLEINGVSAIVSRSGYTGEDGFEISAKAEEIEGIARLLLDAPEVELIGLGARDSLRLEAGLCLYGHDIDAQKTPVEAALTWAIGKKRKLEKDFPGADRVIGQLFDGAEIKRVGLRLEGRAPAREGAQICSLDGVEIGWVTSGGFGPTVGAPIAMGYVKTEHGDDGNEVELIVRGKSLPAKVSPTPFVPHRYKRTTN